MASIAEQLADLKKRRDDLERERATVTREIADATRTLGDKQANLDGLTGAQQAVSADVDATAKLDSELHAVTAALDDTRKRGDGELTKGRKELAALKSRIDQELSEPRRTALLKEIKAIDDAITKATKETDEADAALSNAKTAEAEARETATAAAKKHDDTLQRLQAVPQGIEAERARVAALRAAATNGVDTGRMAEAFVRARDLELALASLEKTLKDDASEELSRQLPELWHEKLDKAEKLTSATRDVGPIQAKAVAAQQARDALIAGRDQQIMKAVNEPPKSPDEQEPPVDPPDRPVDAEKGPADATPPSQ
jgi:chromosome segregation ATPase